MKAILRFQLPATLGSDLAGVVLEVGHHLDRASVSGDKAPFRLRRKLDPN